MANNIVFNSLISYTDITVRGTFFYLLTSLNIKFNNN